MILNLQILLAYLGCGSISFVMFYILLRKEQLETIKAMETKNKKELKRVKKELKQAPLSIQNMMMSKWVAFGGGFYGVMALLTYLVVEFYEVVDFFTSEKTIWATITSLGVGDVVNFFINSVMNFITAIAWPFYWLRNIHGYSAWIWFVVVYLGYLSGQAVAKYQHGKKFV
ncbi:MAG: hypothetical protein R3E90_11220 [Marinicella sp.]|nr:hypothetical protein [Xanthomonadales bacterium]